MMEETIDQTQHNQYSSYKSSELSGIDEVPEKWKWIRANYVFTEIEKRSKTGKEELLSVSEHNGVKPRSESNVNMFMAESYKGYKLCYPGDLVINSLWAWSRGLGISEYEGIVSTAYSVFRPDYSRYNKEYLDYLLRSKPYVNQYFINSKGIWISRLQLSDWSFLRIPILTPPLEEQDRIASFLDKKTAKIDKAITQKERLIALLNERRQIVIQEAVTRGLNPDVPMKDSGVEWIGEIPEHWEVKDIRRIAKMITSNVDKHSTPLEDKVQLCNYVDVYKNDFITDSIDFMEATASDDEIKKFKISSDDVLITKDSEDWLDIGVPARVKHEDRNLICGYHLAILRPSDSVYGGYLHRALESPSVSTQFSVKANGITRYGLSHNAILGTTLPVPPYQEQVEISEFIGKNICRMKEAIKIYKAEIEKLREYKRSLINDAVTGKIKVI